MNQNMVILGHVCTLGNNVHFALWGGIFYNIRTHWLMVSFSSFTSLLIFWLLVLFMVDKDIHSCIWGFFFFFSIPILLHVLKFSSYVHIHLGLFWFLGGFTLLSLCNVPLISGNFLYSEVCFEINISTPAFSVLVFVW